MDSEDQIVLQAKLKNSIIRDLFSQVIKNTKSSRFFYMNLHDDSIKMAFMESDKEVQIYVSMNKEMFQSFNFLANSPVIIKFDIRDLQIIGLIFQNPNIIISLVFTMDNLTVLSQNQFQRWTLYRIQALVQQQQPPEEVRNFNLIGNDLDQHTNIIVKELSVLSNIFQTMSLEKIQNFQINFKNSDNQILIMPLPNMIPSHCIHGDAQDIFTLNVAYRKIQILNFVRFNLKKFKTALTLFQKSKPLQLNFYSNYVKLQQIEKERKNVTIILACLAA